MIKYCLEKWNKNSNKLKQYYKTANGLNECNYTDIVKAVVKYVLNDGTNYGEWDNDDINVIDNGDYQGTLLYLIHERISQPAEYDYIMTYVNYGSCSYCDTLESIQNYGEKNLTETQIKDFMILSKDIITNMIKPYNNGWKKDKDFDEVMYENK